MDLGIGGKRALVTGGARGLGQSAASCLAREGAQVAIVSRTAVDVEAQVEAMGGTAAGHLGLALDLLADGAPDELLSRLQSAGFWPIPIVVHNVGGTLHVTDPLCSLDDWRRVLRFNLELAIELNISLVPPMQADGWGRIVHMSSIAGMENQGPVTYCTAKAALNAYTRSLGRVLSPDGIVVTAVLPGAILCEGGYWDQAQRERPEHVEKYLADRMASHRFGRPEEIGEVTAFLCSEHASFCIGSLVPVDGGQGRSYFGL